MCTIVAEKVAITSYKNLGHPAAFILIRIQDRKSLMLHWYWFSWRGSECVSMVFSTEGSQYFIYVHFWPVATWIAQDGKPEIVDAALTLIFRMGQWLGHLLFCVQRMPISQLGQILMKPIPNCHIYKTNDRWHPVDPHILDLAVTVVWIVF